MSKLHVKAYIVINEFNLVEQKKKIGLFFQGTKKKPTRQTNKKGEECVLSNYIQGN